MLKKCLGIFIVGVILAFIGGIGMTVLALNGICTNFSLAPVYETVTTEMISDNVIIPINTNEEINSIDINVTADMFSVHTGDELLILTDELRANRICYEVTDGCLKIDYSKEFNLLDFTDWTETVVVDITVPEKIYDNVNFSVSSGSISVENIKSNIFTLDFTAGDANFQNISAFNSAQLKMSAGECEFINSNFANTNIKITAGSMIMACCTLSGDNNINMTAGNLSMQLYGRRSDYEVNVEKTAGEVNIYNSETEYNNVTQLTETTVVTEENVTDITISEDFATEGFEYKEPDINDLSGTINIKLTAGNCDIEFMEDIYYE